jgi:hypothetical protein
VAVPARRGRSVAGEFPAAQADPRVAEPDGKTRNGSKWLDYTLEEVAMAAMRVEGT